MSDASHSDSRSAQRREEGSRNANLVCEIQHGCSDAESRLVQQYQRGLLFIANQYTDDPELAKDIVQETFVVVLQRLRRSGIREPEKLTPFIQKTVRNIMIGHLRKSGRRQTVADTDMIERMASCQVNQETDISRWQEALLVRKLLEELPMQRDREILSRFYLEEEEKDEICRTLKLSDLHFNRVLYRARKRFGALIEVYESQQQALLGKAH